MLCLQTPRVIGIVRDLMVKLIMSTTYEARKRYRKGLLETKLVERYD